MINDDIETAKAFVSAVQNSGKKSGTDALSVTETQGTATSSSKDNSDSTGDTVWVRLDGPISSGDDSASVELKTTTSVMSGDRVRVQVVGDAGTGRDMTVTGVIGRGQQVVDAVDETAKIASEALTKTCYGTCSTEGSIKEKVVVVTSGAFILDVGATISVTMTNANAVSAPTLKVGTNDAKPIVTNGSPEAWWAAGASVLLAYDGTQWQNCSTPVYASDVTVGNPTSTHAYIDKSGMDILDGTDSFAMFGKESRVGKEEKTHVLIKPGRMSLVGTDGTNAFDVKSFEDSDGLTTVKITFPAGNNVVTSPVNVTSVVSSLYDDGTNTPEYTLSGNVFTYVSTLTQSGIVTIKTTENTYAYTLGTRVSGKSWGSWSVVEGILCSAESGQSHAEGDRSHASGDKSHAEGLKSESSGTASHSEGESTTASGKRSHAEGLRSAAIGAMSHAEGQDTNASGSGSHTEGLLTTASGVKAHAEGDSTTASAEDSHAEGFSTTAGGAPSHAEGFYSVASAKASHAEGKYTSAGGVASHAQNLYTIASSENQTAIGKYNVEDKANKYLEIAGNGTSNVARSNARTLDWSGNETLAGKIIPGKPVDVANGGTGVTTAAAERNRLGLGNTTGVLPVANGGTGVTSYLDLANVLNCQQNQINTNTGNGTITLTETAANFTHLTIYYRLNGPSNLIYVPDMSVDVWAPNGKYVSLSGMYLATNHIAQHQFRTVYISGTSISSASSSSLGGGANGYLNFSDGDNASSTGTVYPVYSWHNGNIYIIKVIGWR